MHAHYVVGSSVGTRMLKAVTGLFSAKDARTERLRELIVDLEAPAPQTPAAAAAESAVQQSGLNAEQKYAVKRCCNLLYDLILEKEAFSHSVLPRRDVARIKKALSGARCLSSVMHAARPS